MFKDKIVVVTGGGSGIGEALCMNLARQGAKVYVVSVSQEQLDNVVAAIVSEGGRGQGVLLDVFDYPAYQNFVNSLVESEERIDYLFNNAGITLISEMKDTPISRCQEVLNTNLVGVMNGIQLIYPVMCRQGEGHIINTSSLAGILGYPTSAVYAASKAGVLALSNSLRYEGKEFGVKVSAVCPGYVDTGIFKQERILGGVKRESIIEGLPFKMISAEKAANYILKDVARNRRLIIFPLYAKIIAFISAVCPALLSSKYQEVITAFREDSEANTKKV